MDSLQGRIVNDRQRLVDVALDNASLVRWNPDIQQELNVAIYDLKEENVFAPQDLPPSAGIDPGPFTLTLSLSDNRLAMDIRDAETGQPLDKVFLALTPFRRVIRDYFAICESYYTAIKRSTPQQIEAIDMGRRGLHNEGAELLRERLDGKVRVDTDTARRLFTLLCVLHMGVRNDFS